MTATAPKTATTETTKPLCPKCGKVMDCDLLTGTPHCSCEYAETRPKQRIRIQLSDRTQHIFTRGTPKVVLTAGDDGYTTYSTRTGVVRLADGTEHDAILEFCDSDSGEHNGMGLWTDTSVAWQDDDGFCEAIGKTKTQVFPYHYRYDGAMCRDHHVGINGWSR